MREDHRTGDEDGLDDVVPSVDIGRADNLDVVVGHGRYFRNQRGDILEYVSRQYSLDKEHVSPPVNCFEYAEVIHIAVPVEVQIGKDIRGVVKQALEFLYA